MQSRPNNSDVALNATGKRQVMNPTGWHRVKRIPERMPIVYSTVSQVSDCPTSMSAHCRVWSTVCDLLHTGNVSDSQSLTADNDSAFCSSLATCFVNKVHNIKTAITFAWPWSVVCWLTSWWAMLEWVQSSHLRGSRSSSPFDVCQSHRHSW